MSKVQSFKMVKLSQLTLCLANIIIQRIEGNGKVKWKTVTRLANITGGTWWFTLNLTSLIRQTVMSKKEYLANKQNSDLLMSIFIEERAQEIAYSDDSLEETKLNYLISTKKTKEKAWRLSILKQGSKGTGVRRLEIQIEESSRIRNVYVH